MACKPGTLAYRDNMIPKLGKILKKLKFNESMSDVLIRLEIKMKQESDQIPSAFHSCTKNICLKNIYPRMQNAG